MDFETLLMTGSEVRVHCAAAVQGFLLFAQYHREDKAREHPPNPLD
jgi:hypothetical protein